MPGCSTTFCILRTVEKFTFTTPSFCSIRRQADPGGAGKAGIPIQAVQGIVQAWCAVLPIQAADESDLMTALEAVPTHRLAFWDAMLWASAQRAGVRHLLTEDFQLRVTGRHVYQSIQTRKRSLNRKGLRAIVIRQPVPARLEALFLKSHAPSFGVIVTFNAQRSDCGFFFILPASSTILRIGLGARREVGLTAPPLIDSAEKVV
jgi:hypothetical protein